MKINKVKSKQILKLHLLKSRIYEQIVKKNSSQLLTEIDLTQIIINFKKSLQLIFQYHSKNKKILFIGVPKKLEFKINRFTDHVAVSNVFNLQGIISNYSKNFDVEKLSKLQSNNLNSFFPKLTKKPDLIVLFSHEKKQSIITESSLVKIPLIVFSQVTKLKKNELNSFYEVQGSENNFMSSSSKNFFYIGLNFIFKPKIKKSKNLKFTKFSSKSFNNTNLKATKRKFF